MSVRGTYVLLLRVTKPVEVKVGAAGRREFSRGHYCYVGSAFGKTITIENRIGRYLRLGGVGGASPRWHIDYVLRSPSVELRGVYVLEDRQKECEMAEWILGIAVPVRGIGSSDCRCKTHLFRVNKKRVEEALKGAGFRKFARVF